MFYGFSSPNSSEIFPTFSSISIHTLSVSPKKRNSHFKSPETEPGLVLQKCNPSTWEEEAGRPPPWSIKWLTEQPDIQRYTFFFIRRIFFSLKFCGMFSFFPIFIRYFLHLHFKCYSESPLYPPPALLPYPPTLTSWLWRSPVLGHIKFARPRGLSSQWWPTRPSSATYAARDTSSGDTG